MSEHETETTTEQETHEVVTTGVPEPEPVEPSEPDNGGEDVPESDPSE